MPQPVHFLCAQTLRTKVERDFDDLPESAPASLRDSLMELLLKFGEGVPSVRTQICLALSALAAHLPAQHWGTHGAVRWFAERLGSAAGDILHELLCDGGNKGIRKVTRLFAGRK